MIDRRQLFAGIAVVAVAGVAPALSICAASLAAPEITPRAFVLGTPWHFYHLPDGTIQIRHPSGFGFFNAPRPDGSPVFDCSMDSDPCIPLTFRAFERAATFVAKHAYLIRTARQHPGAIYLDYTQRDPRRPFDDVYTEDGPPWPEIRRYYELRGIDLDDYA
jgi:hypothetical protein